MNIFEYEVWIFCFSSAFQSGDSVVFTMEQAGNTVPLESEPNTDNMENSSPGKSSSFCNSKCAYLFFMSVCVLHVWKLFQIAQKFVIGAAGLCCQCI